VAAGVAHEVNTAVAVIDRRAMLTTQINGDAKLGRCWLTSRARTFRARRS